jgi:hypothetical protein
MPRADSHLAMGVTSFTRDPVKEDLDLVSYQKAQAIAYGLLPRDMSGDSIPSRRLTL